MPLFEIPRDVIHQLDTIEPLGLPFRNAIKSKVKCRAIPQMTLGFDKAVKFSQRHMVIKMMR